MMGVGKTTVGKTLSKKLGKDFFEIDQIVENENNMTINDIFKTKGEAFFRKQEEIITLKCLNKSNAVIALGGGAFINKIIRNKILLKARSFWLTLDSKTLKFRLKGNTKRPIINQMKLDDLQTLIDERKKFYCLANFKIDCEKLTLRKISDKIIKLYENN